MPPPISLKAQMNTAQSKLYFLPSYNDTSTVLDIHSLEEGAYLTISMDHVEKNPCKIFVHRGMDPAACIIITRNFEPSFNADFLKLAACSPHDFSQEYEALSFYTSSDNVHKTEAPNATLLELVKRYAITFNLPENIKEDQQSYTLQISGGLDDINCFSIICRTQTGVSVLHLVYAKNQTLPRTII